jgi:CRISPR-associated protein (TIGR02584 family)
MQPHEYSKRILLAVSGMSPQIVTETVYGLAVNQADPPFVPTDIYLITTQSGAKEARLQLLHAETGKFNRLCQDYELPDIRFPEANILVIEDDLGHPLDDIKTPEQNEAAADFITNVVKELTGDDNAALHVSIAGGRKTMGYYVGYALSLFGRSQDRLSHVLVTDRYESLKDFFYPTPQSHVIEDRDNWSLDTKEAEVILAEIPFVRLRGGLPLHLLDGRSSFSESIRLARLVESEPELVIDIKNLCFWVADVKILLTGVNFVFYLWLLNRSLNGEPVGRTKKENADYAQEFRGLCEQYLNELKDYDSTLRALDKGMSKEWLSDRLTAVRKAFEQELGKNAARPFIVQSLGKNNKLQYHIALTEEQISYS